MDRYSQQIPITPSDTLADSVPNGPTDAIYIGGGDGTLRVIDDTGKQCDYIGLTVGAVYPFAVRSVLNTGTGVTGVVGLKR